MKKTFLIGLVGLIVGAIMFSSGCSSCPCACYKPEKDDSSKKINHSETIKHLKAKKDVVLSAKTGEVVGSSRHKAKTLQKDKKTGFHRFSPRHSLSIATGGILLGNEHGPQKLSSESLSHINGSKDIILCGKCGEIKGCSDCCKKGIKMNPETGFNHGSPRDLLLRKKGVLLGNEHGPYTE